MNVLARTMTSAAAAALVPLLLLAGCSRAAPVPPPATMSFCGSVPQVMPTVVEVICNTDDITARSLAWQAWGKPTATAQGTAVVDLCAYADCHTGAYGSVPIRLVASKIAHCGRNARAYSTLRYVFPDGTPWPGIPAKMNISGYISGPSRPLPPANQTVSLTCN